MATDTNPRNWKALGWVIGIGVAAIFLLSWSFMTPVKNSPPTPSGKDGQPLVAQPQQPAEPKVKIHHIGSFIVGKGNKGREFDIPADQSWIASPIGSVDYDWYIDGKLYMKIRAGKKHQYFEIQSPIRKVAYVLADTAHVDAMRWGYALCSKGRPEDKEWWPQAKASEAEDPNHS